MFKIILSLLLFNSCGPVLKKHVVKHKAGVSRQFSTTSPIFNDYVAEFEKAAKDYKKGGQIKVTNIPINLGTPNEEQFEGVCHQYSDNTKEVIIRKEWWDRASPEAKTLMIFHELGHCVLGRDHYNGTLNYQNRKIYYSVMNEVLMPASDFKFFEKEYSFELFNEKDTSFLEAKIAP